MHKCIKHIDTCIHLYLATMNILFSTLIKWIIISLCCISILELDNDAIMNLGNDHVLMLRLLELILI